MSLATFVHPFEKLLCPAAALASSSSPPLLLRAHRDRTSDRASRSMAQSRLSRARRSQGQGAYIHVVMMNGQSNQLSEMVPVAVIQSERGATSRHTPPHTFSSTPATSGQ